MVLDAFIEWCLLSACVTVRVKARLLIPQSLFCLLTAFPSVPPNLPHTNPPTLSSRTRREEPLTCAFGSLPPYVCVCVWLCMHIKEREREIMVCASHSCSCASILVAIQLSACLPLSPTHHLPTVLVVIWPGSLYTGVGHAEALL